MSRVYFAINLLAAVLAWVAYRTSQKPSSKVPGPWYTKWTSIVLDYYWVIGKRSLYVHSLHKRYGPIVRIAPDYVDCATIEATKIIYSTRETFRKSPWYFNLVSNKQPNIFSTNEVEFHRRHRGLLAGPLSESSLKDMVPQITARVRTTIKEIREEINAQGAADVYKWWMVMATNVITELTFGDSFQSNQEYQDAENLLTLATIGAILSASPFLARAVKRIPLPVFSRAGAAVRQINSHAVNSINRYKDGCDTPKCRTLLKNAFEAEMNGKFTLDEILSDSESYVIAGSDTTASALTFLVWSVCRIPKVKDTLSKELRALPHDFGESDLRVLPYLGQVIKETLRLYSPVPSGLPRIVPSAGARICGFWLNGGVTVCSQAYSMHRDPEIFPEPDLFDPARWESPTESMASAFMPFGKGARSCIGIDLAMMEIRLATALFFLAVPTAKPSTMQGMSDADMTPTSYFIMSPKGRRCLIEG